MSKSIGRTLTDSSRDHFELVVELDTHAIHYNIFSMSMVAHKHYTSNWVFARGVHSLKFKKIQAKKTREIK